MDDQQIVKGEAKYWENVISNLSSEGLDFRHRDEFVAKDPKAYWEDAGIAKKLLAYPQKALRTKMKPGMKVLDLGSGSGGNAYTLAKLGADVLGIDVQENTVAMLNKEIKKEPHLKLKFEVGDLNKISLPENHYDAVLSWNSFHHIKESDRLIKEVKKTLKPDGIFILLEHQHTHSILRKLLAAFFWMILPTREKFMEKLKIITGRARGKSEEELSPAEDSAPDDYLLRIKKSFKIKEEKSYVGFVSPFIARIRAPKIIKSALVNCLIALDRLLIRLKILKGEQLFMVGQNIK